MTTKAMAEVRVRPRAITVLEEHLTTPRRSDLETQDSCPSVTILPYSQFVYMFCSYHNYWDHYCEILCKNV